MSKLKDVLVKIAPTVATALGGPLAGYATKLITDKLGLASDSSETDIASAIDLAPPSVIAEIKKIDADYKKELLKAGIALEEIGYLDRDSARGREIKLGGLTTPVLAFSIMTGFFVIIYFAMGAGAQMNEMMLIILGYISGLATQVVSYYFGSSSSSKEKNELLGKK